MLLPSVCYVPTVALQGNFALCGIVIELWSLATVVPGRVEAGNPTIPASKPSDATRA
jgi:hypothetical protein